MPRDIYRKNSNPGSIIYLPHGGGPWPLLGDERHTDLIHFLETVPAALIKPSAILIISGHWEEEHVTVTGSSTPPLLYDYYGFPEETYAITYPAPGNIPLAKKIVEILQQQNIAATADTSRGYDHGVFVPLKIMYPEASIPCIQLSLVNSLHPKEHIAIGRALAELQEENLLIIGSGSSFHNLRAFHEPQTEQSQTDNNAFEQWIAETMSSRQLGEKARAQILENWLTAPAARYCHPREEHLLPLHVCYGIASAPVNRIVEVSFLGKSASACIW